MATTLPTYNPALVLVSFAGVPLSGFADGTFIEIERNVDAFEVTVGAGGETVRTQSQNRSGKITFTVLQSSIANDILDAKATADELTGTGAASFFMKDLNGTTICTAANCWVKKKAAIKRGKEISNSEWVLETDLLDMHPGSLAPVTP